MENMETSSMRRLATSAYRVMREAAEADLANTIQLMTQQLEDTEAQSDIDELIVVLQGRERATERIQAAVAWVQANYESSDVDDEDDNSPTQVSLSPSTNDKE
jgi:hypothetical protein